MSTVTQKAICPNCQSDWITLQEHRDNAPAAKHPVTYNFHCYSCFQDTPLKDTLAEAADLISWQALIAYKPGRKY